MRIVVGEHNRDVNGLLRTVLTREGHAVSFALDGVETLWQIQTEHPDVVLLDWMIPITGGLQVCRKVRETPDIAATPIIMLVDDSPLTEDMKEMNVQVEDYLAKPFNADELLHHLNLVRSRSRATPTRRLLTAGPIEMDPDRWTVRIDGEVVHLTIKEFRLLQELIEAAGRVLTREILLERIWGYAQQLELNTRTVDVHIGRLRNKLGDAAPVIRTVRNIGYRVDSGPPS